jgi:hypothetical protein
MPGYDQTTISAYELNLQKPECRVDGNQDSTQTPTLVAFWVAITHQAC